MESGTKKGGEGWWIPAGRRAERGALIISVVVIHDIIIESSWRGGKRGLLVLI